MESKSITTTTGPNPEYIKNLFGSIASTYDKTNGFITLGLVPIWRNKMIVLSGAKPGDSVLDCATGTGDLALLFKKQVGPSGKVIGSDFCKEMIEPGLNLEIQECHWNGEVFGRNRYKDHRNRMHGLEMASKTNMAPVCDKQQVAI